jgi:hypothetical protein
LTSNISSPASLFRFHGSVVEIPLTPPEDEAPSAAPRQEFGVEFYASGLRSEWEAVVEASAKGTLLHSRAFLDYHGDRFRDRSLVFFAPGDPHPFGIWPIVEAPEDRRLLISHAGSTFGGLVLRGSNPVRTAGCIAAGARRLMAEGYRAIRNKLVPVLLTAQPDETDLRIFLRSGRILRADLWSLVRLDRFYRPAAKRRASVRAAERHALRLRDGDRDEDWAQFHALLHGNLAERHGVAPVHSLQELRDLRARLGSRSGLLLAFSADGNLAAGTWLIDYGHGTRHTQYIASSEEGRRDGAVDLLLATAIDRATRQGMTQFSFGINTLPDGVATNLGLMRYKLRFGGGVCTQLQIECELVTLTEVRL